ncbi:hypothetical protein GQX73_g10283 [Xylaria multiplex]|uniref:Uncharacterized protein n=1 Tax=Xylaria multiplex TaxID=323545 RepID=A0A7C8ML19_9PEZI|nr:hypothetical protein GQX73_g10283 [Xylaria multiplex]
MPPSQFLSYLSNHQNAETRKLLQPYLYYEAWLRTAFVRGYEGIDNFANIVPIYNGYEETFKIRAIDRERTDRGKYIMPLSDHAREEDSALAITASIEEYRRNFNAFSHGALAGLDWSNIVVAGSSALLPLLSHRKDVPMVGDPRIDKSLEDYFQTIARTSDIDIFLYGIDDEDAAITLICQLESMVRMNQNMYHGDGKSLRSKKAITFISPNPPYRHVQIILRLYKSISEILTGFDVDCACVAFDGSQVYSNPRGITAIATRTNTVDLTRRGPAYENRLWKYRCHNFEVFWDSLERSRINTELFEPFMHGLEDPEGLARLLSFERVLREQREEEDIILEGLAQSINRSGGSVLSEYALYDVPNSEYLTLENQSIFLEDLRSHPDDPCLVGGIQEVIAGANPSAGEEEGLSNKVSFIKHIPGQQMVECFEPLVDDDW